MLPKMPSLNAGMYIKILKNLWLTAPKGAISVNETSSTDWQRAVRRDNVISITFSQV